MGLRIIDRKPTTKPILAPQNRVAQDELLLLAALQWSHAIGGDKDQRQAEFMAKVSNIRARLTTAKDATAVAADIGASIRGSLTDVTKSQGTIDPDTLLELL